MTATPVRSVLIMRQGHDVPLRNTLWLDYHYLSVAKYSVIVISSDSSLPPVCCFILTRVVVVYGN